MGETISTVAMALLKKKSWHVGSYENQRRVARDEHHNNDLERRREEKAVERTAAAIREQGRDRDELFLSFLETRPPVGAHKPPRRARGSENDDERRQRRLDAEDPMTAVRRERVKFRRGRFERALVDGPDDEMRRLFDKWEGDLESLCRYVEEVGLVVVDVIDRFAPELAARYRRRISR